MNDLDKGPINQDLVGSFTLRNIEGLEEIQLRNKKAKGLSSEKTKTESECKPNQ